MHLLASLPLKCLAISWIGARVNARTHTSHNNPSNQRSHADKQADKQADNGPTGQTVATTETAFKALEHTVSIEKYRFRCVVVPGRLFTQVLRWLTHSPLHPSATRHFSSSARRQTSSARLLYKGNSDSKKYDSSLLTVTNYFRAGDGSSRPRGVEQGATVLMMKNSTKFPIND